MGGIPVLCRVGHHFEQDEVIGGAPLWKPWARKSGPQLVDAVLISVNLAAATNGHVGGFAHVAEAQVQFAKLLHFAGPQVREKPDRSIGVHFQRGHGSADELALVIGGGQHGHCHVFNQFTQLGQCGRGLRMGFHRGALLDC